MSKIKIELIKSYNCNGYMPETPEIITRFIKETGADVEIKEYNAWGVESINDIPDYILTKIKAMCEGKESSSGFFCNEQWIQTSAHNSDEYVSSWDRLVKAAGINTSTQKSDFYAKKINELSLKGSVISKVSFNDTKVTELNTFCTHFDKIVFFDSTIKNLSVICEVDKFDYMGYDIKKLIKLAEKHPDLFRSAKLEPYKNVEFKPDIDDVKVSLLTEKELNAGYHPCIIINSSVNPGSKLHKEISAQYGGWGYEAKYKNNHICGFLGIMPKNIAQKDVQFFISAEGFPPERTLLLTCIASGGVFGPLGGLGIAKKMVRKAVEDAKEKGYLCIDGNPIDPTVGHIFERCGFKRIEWSTGDKMPNHEQAFYRLALQVD